MSEEIKGFLVGTVSFISTCIQKVLTGCGKTVVDIFSYHRTVKEQESILQQQQILTNNFIQLRYELFCCLKGLTYKGLYPILTEADLIPYEMINGLYGFKLIKSEPIRIIGIFADMLKDKINARIWLFVQKYVNIHNRAFYPFLSNGVCCTSVIDHEGFVVAYFQIGIQPNMPIKNHNNQQYEKKEIEEENEEE